MLTTDLTILDAGEPGPGLWNRVREQMLRFFGLHRDDPDATVSASVARPHSLTAHAPAEPMLRLVTIEPDIVRPPDDFRWRRHPLLLGRPTSDADTGQREARHDAVRGLYAARAGAIEVAICHFTRAARCPEIDLSAIPGFWQLSRSAMMTAVEAYERAGRIREASALNARIRTMYRPRALTAIPANIRHLPEPSPKISSNS